LRKGGKKKREEKEGRKKGKKKREGKEA